MVVANKQPKYKYDKYGSKKRSNKQGKRTKFEQKKKKETPFALKAVAIGCIIVVFGFIVVLYINQFVQISRTNYQIERLQKELNELQNKNEKIRLAIAQNQSLDKIETLAREEYQMVDPTNEEIYYITLKNKSNNNDKTINDEPEKEEEIQIVRGVTDWFKNLTSVEAGTLDE